MILIPEPKSSSSVLDSPVFFDLSPYNPEAISYHPSPKFIVYTLNYTYAYIQLRTPKIPGHQKHPQSSSPFSLSFHRAQ